MRCLKYLLALYDRHIYRKSREFKIERQCTRRERAITKEKS